MGEKSRLVGTLMATSKPRIARLFFASAFVAVSWCWVAEVSCLGASLFVATTQQVVDLWKKRPESGVFRIDTTLFLCHISHRARPRQMRDQAFSGRRNTFRQGRGGGKLLSWIKNGPQGPFFLAPVAPFRPASPALNRAAAPLYDPGNVSVDRGAQLMYTLHSYFRSSTSTRVRAALALKGLSFAYAPVSLVDGEQHSDRFLAVNPEGLVPALAVGPGKVLSQSLAIIEYLDEVHPDPPLLPGSPLARARVRSLAAIVGCDIHPINNLRVLKYLQSEFDADKERTAGWFRHWAAKGCAAIETRLAKDSGTGHFCHGDAPTVADICLFAQVINNRRFDVDMAPYPTVNRIFDRCAAMSAFQSAMPDAQPDAR